MFTRKKILIGRSILLFWLLFFTIQLKANMPPPKYFSNTTYHFTNINTFAQCTFYIKNIQTKKVKKIKQDDIVVISKSSSQKCLEVWCVNKKTRNKSNTILLCIKSGYQDAVESDCQRGIEFDLEDNKLTYTHKEYKEKKENNVPLFYITNNNLSNNFAVICSFATLFIFTFFYFLKSRKMKLHV